MLKRNSGSGTGEGSQRTFVRLLMLVLLPLFLSSCSVLSRKGVKDEIPTEPIIMDINGLEYWCTEKRVFTALVQEASRNCD